VAVLFLLRSTKAKKGSAYGSLKKGPEAKTKIIANGAIESSSPAQLKKRVVSETNTGTGDEPRD